MIKVKDGYAKLIGTTYSGSAARLLLSNGGDKAVSDFAASSHTHSASDITSGTLSVARGGTGATSFTSGAALIGNGTGAVSTRSITSSATSGSTALITSGGVYNALTAKMNASITSIELNSSGSLASYGGFIDFHFHDSNKKPLNDAGTIVSSTPDYTSRIIEDAAGTISVNGVKFKGNKVTASGGFVGNLTGVADSAINLSNKPSLLISGNTIAVKAGEKTSDYITVPYATSAYMVSSYEVASSSNTKRRIWIDWTSKDGKVAYSDDLTYQTDIKTLFAPYVYGKITVPGGSYSWYQVQQYNSSNANPSYYDATCAIVNINSYTGWQPWIRGVDEEKGSWTIGQYATNLHIGYIPKSNTTNGLTYRWDFGKDGSTIFPGAIKFNKILIPTSSGGTTYGAGTSGQVLKSNGTTVYWASDSNSNTWRAIQVNGTQIAGTGTGTYAVNFKSGTGITVSGTAGSSSAANAVTITNAGVRATTINGNYLRVNTNGTNKDLTIPYATSAGSATTAGSANWLNTNDKLTYGASGLNYFNINGTAGNTKANNTPTSAWYHIIRMNHGNSGGYLADIAVPLNDVDGVWWRQIRYGSFYGWYKILDSNNYDDYVNTTNFPGLNKTGTVTSVATGTGLTGGTITSSGTISINSTYQTYISNGNTAYRWGNHASAKYMKAVGRHSGSMNLNKVDSTMSVITEIRPSEITTTNLPSDYGTSYGCLISARDGNSTYGHGKMQILGCDKKFWMRATQGAGEENDGTWCRLALTSDLPTKTSQLTNDSGYITSYVDTAAGKTFKTLSSKSHSGWTNNATDDKILPTMSFIAYWNGAYNSGNNSNLTYCANGTILGSNNYTSYVNTTNFPGLNKTGTVTKVSTGTGLTGGNITSTGTISINSTYQTYISNGNTAYGWGNHANAGYIKSTSILKGWSDTRSAATKPNDYNGAFKVIGIKSAGTTLGLTSTQAGDYATIIGWRGWSDSSGGYAWEIASTDKNRLYVRSGSTTSWNNGWKAIAYTSDIPTKTSQLTNDSGYITATSLNGYVNEIETSGSGNAITSASKSGKKITFTKGTTFLTAHQTIYALTIKNSAGTTQLTYTPNSAAGSITLTKAMVGLGNVDNTADANKTVAVANKLGTATKGSTTKPIYLNLGTATECSTYAGGTAVTLNGSSKAASTASFYAPTTAGMSGYLLKSNGSGAPTWTSTIGSSTTSLTASYITTMYADALYLKSYYTTSGDIYISGFTTVPDSTSRVRLYTARYAIIKNNGNKSTCAIYAPGGFYESSDERLKRILNPIKVDLDAISKLRKIYYTWKDEPNGSRQLGVVAQDVRDLYPELVDVNKDTGYLSLAYDKLSVIALAAIDELYNMIKTLRKENEELKGRLSK